MHAGIYKLAGTLRVARATFFTTGTGAPAWGEALEKISLPGAGGVPAAITGGGTGVAVTAAVTTGTSGTGTRGAGAGSASRNTDAIGMMCSVAGTSAAPHGLGFEVAATSCTPSSDK